MAFNFGNTQQTGFGSSPAKPTGFGTPFGAAPTSQPSTGFSFGSSFGAAPQATGFGAPAQQSTFGATSQPSLFGATQTPSFGTAAQPSAFGTSGFGSAPALGATAPTFGASTGGFGAQTGAVSAFGTPATSAPAFGSTFGAPSTSAPAFGATGFGAQQQAPSLFSTAAAAKPGGLFGTTTSTTPSLFGTPGAPAGGTGLFGSTAPTTSTPSLFGSTTPGTGLFGATAPTTSTPSLFGSSFGAATSAPGATSGLFGATSAQGTSGFGGGLFGGTATSQPSLFGGAFGTSTNTVNTGFSGFGTGTTGFGGQQTLFGKPATQQVPAQDNQLQQVLASFYNVTLFNDERDDILKKWNILQASWGTGKGYYGPNSVVQYTSTNPLYKFKSVGYNIIIENDNSEGLVKLIFNKKESELRSQKDALVNGIGGILGNKPTLTVVVDNIRALSDTKSEITISVLEKGVTGSVRKIPASDLSTFLNNPTQKQQLTNVGVQNIVPYVTPSKVELEEYLKKPPPGIDDQMWEAAKADNPDPKKYMPVSINGFTDLRNRMQNQEYETGLHKAFLEKVDKDISELRKKHAASTAQITELKQKFLQLQHRILRILVKQECTRKVGLTLQPEEELLRGRLETLNAQLQIPTQFKGQLMELVSCLKTFGNIGRQYNEHYKIDPQVQEDIKQFLKMEQDGISHLINIINNDMQALEIINGGLQQAIQNKTGR